MAISTVIKFYCFELKHPWFRWYKYNVRCSCWKDIVRIWNGIYKYYYLKIFIIDHLNIKNVKAFCNGAPQSVRNNIVEKIIGICSSQLAYSVVYVEILNRKKKHNSYYLICKIVQILFQIGCTCHVISDETS